MPLGGTIFQKSRGLHLSFLSHSSASSISHETGCPGRSPQLRQLCHRLLKAEFQAGLLTWWQPALQTSHSNIKCSSQNFLCDLTSGSSYGALVPSIFVSTPVPLSLFCLPSLVRAKDPRDAWACRVDIRTPPLSSRRPLPQLYHKSLHILTVTNTILQLLRSSFQESMGC